MGIFLYWQVKLMCAWRIKIRLLHLAKGTLNMKWWNLWHCLLLMKRATLISIIMHDSFTCSALKSSFDAWKSQQLIQMVMLFYKRAMARSLCVEHSIDWRAQQLNCWMWIYAQIMSTQRSRRMIQTESIGIAQRLGIWSAVKLWWSCDSGAVGKRYPCDIRT